jgi:hypothetical protein
MPLVNGILPDRVPNRVEYRCDPCARDLGQASPLLAQCAHNGVRWTIMVAERESGRRRERHAEHMDSIMDSMPELRRIHDQLRAYRAQAYPSAPDVDVYQHNRSQLRPLRRNENPSLACRRCGNRPRRSRRSLYELAESGRRIVYV